jgi:hypothetical protein
LQTTLTWTSNIEFPEVIEARCGTRLIGSYREFDSGRVRWEIVPAFNVEHRYIDDSKGRAEDATSAKAEIEKRFAAWLVEAGLVRAP